MDARLELDHVLIAVADLARAARELHARHGLVPLEGGRHPGWGTANRIVPLGDAYLELIAVVDEAEAAQSPFGRWVAEARADGPLGWAVRTRDLDGVARRLELPVGAGSRVDPEGRHLQWRFAGVEQAMAEPSLPFFIEWAPETPFPGGAAAAPLAVRRLELRGDADRLAAWLGPHGLPVAIRTGSPAVAHVVLGGTSGEVVLSGAGS